MKEHKLSRRLQNMSYVCDACGATSYLKNNKELGISIRNCKYKIMSDYVEWHRLSEDCDEAKEQIRLLKAAPWLDT
jgi:DNA-directed RNA polymerase subunit RPC12/RpoP